MLSVTTVTLKLRPFQFDLLRTTIQKRIDALSEELKLANTRERSPKDNQDLRKEQMELTDIMRVLNS